MPKLISRFSICLVFAVISIIFLTHFLSVRSAHRPLEPPRLDEFVPDIHIQWAALPTQYPVTSVTALPVGNRTAISQIQANFDLTEDPTRTHGVDEDPFHKHVRNDRMKAISDAFDHSWQGYKDRAWMHDEVHPLSGDWSDPFGGWAATLVDSLDTLWIMEKREQFEEAVKAVKNIDFSACKLDTISVFETTIRYLGGFLGAYDISQHRYKILLTKASEVGEMLYKAFDTPNRMPVTQWSWQDAASGEDQTAALSSLLAEVGSLSLEFTRLSQLTGNNKYFDAIQRITTILQRDQPKTRLPGLWPTHVNMQRADATEDHEFSLGGMSDSVYEYLPKQYILLAGGRSEYRRMYRAALKTMKKYLAFEPLIPPPLEDAPPSLAISQFPGTAESELRDRDLMTPLLLGNTRIQGPKGDSSKPRPTDPTRPGFEAQGQQLTCFAGGMVALAARAFDAFLSSHDAAADLNFATRLVEGCAWSYRNTPSGIGPEIFYAHPCRRGQDAVTGGAEPDWAGQTGNCTWDRSEWLKAVKKADRGYGDIDDTDPEEIARRNDLPEGFTRIEDSRYILRPEFAESLFVLYRITGDEKYREAGWNMFMAIRERAKTEVSFAGLENVMAEDGGEKIDSTESFWTAETLKYLYLLYTDEHVASLDEFVFNTEAHPFRWRTMERSSELILKR